MSTVALAMGEPEDEFVNFFMTSEGAMIFLEENNSSFHGENVNVEEYIRNHVSKAKRYPV